MRPRAAARSRRARRARTVVGGRTAGWPADPRPPGRTAPPRAAPHRLTGPQAPCRYTLCAMYGGSLCTSATNGAEGPRSAPPKCSEMLEWPEGMDHGLMSGAGSRGGAVEQADTHDPRPPPPTPASPRPPPPAPAPPHLRPMQLCPPGFRRGSSAARGCGSMPRPCLAGALGLTLAVEPL